MFAFKKDFNITKKMDDLLNVRFVDRLFSLTTSIVFLLLSLKFFYMPKSPTCFSLLDMNSMFVAILFLISSILLFLDFLNVNFILTRKKIWLPIFLVNCVCIFCR